MRFTGWRLHFNQLNPVLLACLLCKEKVLVVLRDGRKLIGVLRSYDQFGAPPCPRLTCLALNILTSIPANLVLEGTVERKHLAHYYADQAVGVMIIRGENVVLLGEIVRVILSVFDRTNICYRIWIQRMKYHYNQCRWKN